MTFDEAFHELLGHEGEYVDHPRDPGGATRWGVTERVAREYGYASDMKVFPVETAKAIYRKQYWDAVRAEELPAPLRYPTFDAAVRRRWRDIVADRVPDRKGLGSSAIHPRDNSTLPVLALRAPQGRSFPLWRRSFRRGRSCMQA